MIKLISALFLTLALTLATSTATSPDQPIIPNSYRCNYLMDENNFEAWAHEDFGVDRDNCTFTIFDLVAGFNLTVPYRIVQVFDPTIPVLGNRVIPGLREVSIIGAPFNIVTSNVEFTKVTRPALSTVGGEECGVSEASLLTPPLRGPDVDNITYSGSLILPDAEFAYTSVMVKKLTNDGHAFYFAPGGTSLAQAENPNVPNNGLAFTGTIYDPATGTPLQIFSGFCPTGVPYSFEDYRQEFGTVSSKRSLGHAVAESSFGVNGHRGVYGSLGEVPWSELF
jgi:hypothetical protein